MKDKVYLIMDKHGIQLLRKTKPKLNSGEVAVRLSVEISDKFFSRFIPDAELSIPDNAVIEPDITVEVSREETEAEMREEWTDLEKEVERRR